MRRVLGIAFLALSFVVGGVFAASRLANIQGPKGSDAKIADATFALYASSQTAGVSNAFICTAETVGAVSDKEGQQIGYILLTAGHCTPQNPEIPADATYAVSPDITSDVKQLMPVQIVKAVMNEPLDFALLYLPTKKHFAVDQIESASKVRIGDSVTDVNFALGLAKQYSHGQVATQLIHDADPQVNGDFLCQMYGGPGASGSAVLHDDKLIGIVIYGFTEGSIGMGVEPIDAILAALPQTPDYTSPSPSPSQFNVMTGTTPWIPWAQRGRVRPHSAEPREPRQPRDSRPNHSGKAYHQHYRATDVRVVRGHRCVGYAGVFFFPYGDGSWMPWVFTDEVYFVSYDGGTTWFVESYTNPGFSQVVVIVE